MPAPHHSVFLQAICPSCHSTNSVKALKAQYSTNEMHPRYNSFFGGNVGSDLLPRRRLGPFGVSPPGLPPQSSAGCLKHLRVSALRKERSRESVGFRGTMCSSSSRSTYRSTTSGLQWMWSAQRPSSHRYDNGRGRAIPLFTSILDSLYTGYEVRVFAGGSGSLCNNDPSSTDDRIRCTGRLSISEEASNTADCGLAIDAGVLCTQQWTNVKVH